MRSGGDDVTNRGRLFYTCVAATGKAQSPIVWRTVVGSAMVNAADSVIQHQQHDEVHRQGTVVQFRVDNGMPGQQAEA